MSRLNKLKLVATMATVMAFAFPSSAAAVWTISHTDLPAGWTPQLHATGEFAFTSPAGGVNCITGVTSTFQLTGGQTTGHVNQLSPTLTNCLTSGALNGCKLNAIHVEGTPWTMHIVFDESQVTGAKMTYTFSGLLCPPSITISGNGLRLVPREGQKFWSHTTIQAFSIQGQLSSSLGGTVTMSGYQLLTASDENDYGFT